MGEFLHWFEAAIFFINITIYNDIGIDTSLFKYQICFYYNGAGYVFIYKAGTQVSVIPFE